MGKKQSFIIAGRLPGLNEVINACKGHWHHWCQVKAHAEQVVQYAILAGKVGPVVKVARIIITYYEKDRRRDVDNVFAGGNKIILDALQKQGILKNDSQRYVKELVCRLEHDQDKPRIEVIIEEELDEKEQSSSCAGCGFGFGYHCRRKCGDD